MAKSFWKLSCWQVNGPDFLGRFIGNKSNGISEKVQAELHEKPSLIPFSGFRGRFSINGTDLYTMVNAIPGRNLPVLNSEPTGFAHANGKQP